MDNRKSINTLFKEIIIDRDISFLFLMLGVFLLPISILLSSYALVFSLLSKFTQVIFTNTKLFKLKILKTASLLGLVFFVYAIINAILQSNFIYVIDIFEEDFVRLPLFFLVPMIIRGKKSNELLYYSLYLGTFVAIIYVFVTSLALDIKFDKYSFIKLLNFHHTYLSLFLLFIVNKVLFSYYKKKKIELNKTTIFNIFVVVLSFLVIFTLGSKFAMVVFLIFLGAYTLVFFLSKKIILIVSFLTIIVGFFVFNNTLATTYRKALDFRLEIWQEAIKDIKENPFFGNLSMSEKNVLNYKHYKSGKYYLMDSDLNTHNQYLSIFLRFGFVGFFLLMLQFFLLFRAKYFKLRNPNFINVIGFCFIIITVFYIENIIDRHRGAVASIIFFNYYLILVSEDDKK